MNCPPVSISHSSSKSNPATVVNPLCIILVKNGSKGDRLLFRYPYSKTIKTIGNNNNIGIEHAEDSVKNVSFSSSGRTRSAGESMSSGARESSKGGTSSSDHVIAEASQGTGIKGQGNRDAVDGIRRLGEGSATTTDIPTIYTSTPSSLTLQPSALIKSSPFIGTTTKNLFDTPLSQLSAKSFTSPALGGPTADYGLGMTRMRKVSRTTAHIISRGDSENPYSVSRNPNDELFSEPGFVASTDGRKFSLDGSEMLSQLSDKDLSNLLAVNSDLSERKFELKLNFVRFVGHPTLMHNPKDVRPINPEFQTSVKIFHIVFCLNAAASHSIVKCFFDLSKRLGIGLRHEEYRCGFMNQEMREIIATHDEACTAASEHLEEKEDLDNVQERVFDDILAKSKLAQLLKRVYDDVCSTGYTFTRINNWVQISFCLPHRVHVLPFRKHAALVEPETIHRCLEAIRPYHALLLLVDPESLVSSFWVDSSSTIPRILQVYSPLKSLQTLAADADLTLSQVVEIASHLVYWAHATVIYPLCESNVYFLAPDTPIDSPELDEEFREEFPGLSMLQVFSDFSLAIPLGERMNPMLGGTYVQAQLVDLVTWMLQKRLLIQLHTYIYLATYLDVEAGANQQLDQISVNVDPDISLNLNLSRPYDFLEEDDATVSDTFSEITGDEIALVSPLSLSAQQQNREDGSSPDIKDKEDVISESDTQQDRARQNNNNDEILEPLDKFKSSLPELNNEAVKRALGLVNKSSISVQDIKMFSKLAKYFTGEFHIEEIMYRENVRRSQLMLLLDKFRECLITVEKEDADISFFRNSDLYY